MILEDMKYGRLRHLTLLDPEKYNEENVKDVIAAINEAGSSGILVGGSTGTTQKRVDCPVLIVK
ncbi:MAG: geranylgeranylglyceryl/heptaprenylglyceryl phosphate synthase [Thermoplasmatales archaeon]